MTLYLTYDGLTDPLGQSQILPYLIGLTQSGHEIHIISFEKKDRWIKESKIIRQLIDKHPLLTWHPLTYHLKPKLFSTFYDLYKLNKTAKKLIAQYEIKVIHCRSYPTAVIGSRLKRKLGTKFIFDMRGFYIDERFDGGIWNKNNFLWKSVYPRLKKMELNLLRAADTVVSLTEHGKQEMQTWPNNNQKNYYVIPCAADLDHFNLPYQSLDGSLDIVYLGSLGTWYLLDEMLDFYKLLSANNHKSRFHFITRDNPDIIFKSAEDKGISSNLIKVYPSTREELPSFLQKMDLAIFFIKPSFSKKASSPTKMGELLGMGIPVICNGQVGDIDLQSQVNPDYVIATKLNKESYQRVINRVPELLEKRKHENKQIRLVAKKYFSLVDGIKKYDQIYNDLKN